MTEYVDLGKEALVELFMRLEMGMLDDLLEAVTDIDMIDQTVDYDLMEQVYRSKETGNYYVARWMEWDEDGQEKAAPVSFVHVKPVEITTTIYEEAI